jgi:hypothetical protein
MQVETHLPPQLCCCDVQVCMQDELWQLLTQS